MIEVDLLPPRRGRAATRIRRPVAALPGFGGSGRDPWSLGAAVTGVVAVAAAAWLTLSLGVRRDEAQVGLERALQDSARHTDRMANTGVLLARGDSIAARVAVLQEIDQGRFVWPHILDEIARAVGDHTWLLQLYQVSGGAEPRVRIVGQAGNLLALAVLMDRLEASPFLRAVQVLGSSQVPRSGQLVYRFELDVTYEQPPMEYLETLPLLEGAPMDLGTDPPGR